MRPRADIQRRTAELVNGREIMNRSARQAVYKQLRAEFGILDDAPFRTAVSLSVMKNRKKPHLLRMAK